jgi:hypothetical protein
MGGKGGALWRRAVYKLPPPGGEGGGEGEDVAWRTGKIVTPGFQIRLVTWGPY